MKFNKFEIDDDGDTLLHFAARDGNIRQITKYVTLGIDINVRNNLGWSPLMFAIKNNHFKAIKTLAYLGANLTHKNEYGYCPLSIAASSGNLEIVRFILKKRLKNGERVCDIEKPISPLAMAVLKGHVDIIRYFYEKSFRVDVNSVFEGVTPMYIATVTKNKHVLDIMRRSGCVNIEKLPKRPIPIITISDEDSRPYYPRDSCYTNDVNKIQSISKLSKSPVTPMSQSPIFFPFSPQNIHNVKMEFRNFFGDFKQQIRKYHNRSRSTCVPPKEPNKEEYPDDVFDETPEQINYPACPAWTYKNRQFINLLRRNSLDSCMSLFEKHEIDLDVFVTLNRRDLHEIGVDCEKRDDVLELVYRLKQQGFGY